MDEKRLMKLIDEYSDAARDFEAECYHNHMEFFIARDKHIKKRAEVEAVVQRITATLAFYADPANYEHDAQGYHDGTTPIIRDNGSRARKALQQRSNDADGD